MTTKKRPAKRLVQETASEALVPVSTPAARVVLKGALGQFPDIDTETSLNVIAQSDPYIWVALHRRLKGKPLFYDITKEIIAYGGKEIPHHHLLRHRPFLVQPLLDSHPHKVYKKGRQAGVSELALNEVVYFLATHPGTKWVTTFPRDSQLRDFSVTRIAEALDETPKIKSLLGIPNQLYTRRIGESFWILRSAWESDLGEGVDADGVTLDEKDRMKEGIDIAFRESLTSSNYGLLREISTPSLPGRGIDEPFQNSCQYEWFIRCTKCGMRQPIKYPDNIIQLKDIPVGTKQLEPNSYDYQCSKTKCRGKLDRRMGEWVPKYPEKTLISGYHMPQTIAPWISPTELMQKKITYKFLQLFFNYVLGECSIGEKILISEDNFYNCIAGHPWATCRTNQWSRIVAGVDWGHFNWAVVIGVNAFNNLPYLIGIFVCEDDDRDPLGSAKAIDNYLSPFDPDMIVADSGYGKDRNAFLLRKWEDKFAACYYNPSDKHSRTFKPQFVAQSNRVLADRTIALKGACQIIRERGIGLPAYDQLLQLLISHFKALAPLHIEEDGEVYEIIDKTGDDHLVHCMAYALMAFDKMTEGWGSFSIIA